jgi:hypothetical protein
MANLTIVKMTGALSLDVSAVLAKGDKINCALSQDCDPTELSQSSYENYFNTDKSSWNSLGLDPNLLHINEIAFGFVPAFLEKEKPNKPEDINAKLFKPMSIVRFFSLVSYEGFSFGSC